MVRCDLCRAIIDSWRLVVSQEWSTVPKWVKSPPLSTSSTTKEFSLMAKTLPGKSSPSEDSNSPSKSLVSKEEPKAAKSRLSSKKKKSPRITPTAQSESHTPGKPVENPWPTSKDSRSSPSEESSPSWPVLKLPRRNDSLLFKSQIH